MPAVHSLVSRSVFFIKASGAVALMTYFLATRFYFDTPLFLFAALLLVGTVLFFAWTSAIFKRDNIPTVSYEPGHAAEPWLIAAEDGALLLPLFALGINAFTALAATIVFTWMQLRCRPKQLALALGGAYFFVILWVLPQGIWMVVAAHAVAEITARRLFRPQQPATASTAESVVTSQ